MNGYNFYVAKKAELSSAKNFLALIGKPQRTTARGVGAVHRVETHVEIYHQETDGAKNYHENSVFNLAFAKIVRSNFTMLAAEAIKLLEKECAVAAQDAKAEIARIQNEMDAIVEGASK